MQCGLGGTSAFHSVTRWLAEQRRGKQWIWYTLNLVMPLAVYWVFLQPNWWAMDWINSQEGGWKIISTTELSVYSHWYKAHLAAGYEWHAQGLMPIVSGFSNNLDDWIECILHMVADCMNWEGWSVHWKAGLLFEGLCQAPKVGCQEPHEIHQRQMESPSSGME